MSKEQNKYMFNEGYYTASAPYTAGATTALTITLANYPISHDGPYKFIADITDLDYTTNESYIMTIYTNSGATEICRKVFNTDDLFEYSSGSFRGSQSITTWLNVDSLTTNITVVFTLADGTGTAGMTCEVGITDGN